MHHIMTRYLRFVSHEGPIGLSQVFLNWDYNGYEESAPLHAGTVE